jgi:hypothetical protein
MTMLFDLRGRGRRRTIQAIYLFLAILLGGGLIFFGIGGGGGGGGLLNAVGQNGTNGSGTDVFASNVKAAEKRVAAAPKDPAAWVALEHARFQVAGTGKNFDQTSGTFTSAGKTQLQQVKAAWDRYLALKPKTPSSDAAKEMVQALGPAGLNEIPAAVGAEEIVVGQNASSPAEYARLALLAYLAGQTRKGDLASAQAIGLAPKDQQTALKQELAQAKTQAQAQVAQQAQQQLGTGTGAQLPGG